MPQLPLDHDRLRSALARRLAWHRHCHDPQRCPGNRSPWLARLRRWQAERLRAGFSDLLRDPATRAAAEFFLTDLYGDRDFSGRDRDFARIAPAMAHLLPSRVLRVAVQAVELGTLSHRLDLRMAALLERRPGAAALDTAAYARAYRDCGCPRLRRRQIQLIETLGTDLGWAVQKPGVRRLLRLARLPARAAGLAQLQGFLERGFDAFAELPDAADFVRRIGMREREVSRRLFASDPAPF